MDELQVLREHYKETVEPSPEFIEGVRERVEEGVAQPLPPHRLPPARPRGQRYKLLAAVAATLLLVATGASVFALLGDGAVSKPGLVTSWRLAGYISTPSWAQNEAGPSSGFLTCPTSQVCYDASPQSSGGTVLYTSTDFGRTWVASRFSNNDTITSPLECTSNEICAVGATNSQFDDSIAPMFVVTDDGGNTWTSHHLPDGLGPIYQLSCSSATSCFGLTAPQIGTHVAASFIATNNGGATWAIKYAFPADEDLSSISCSSAENCLVIGDQPSKSPADRGYAVSWITHNGGKNWTSETTTEFSFGQVSLACSTTTSCDAMASVRQTITQCAPTVPNNTVPVPTCSTGYDVINEPVSSTDGGITWRLGSFPSDVPAPNVFALSCPTATSCWAAGSERAPNQSVIGGTPIANGNSPVVFETQNGAAWTATTLPTPRSAPQGETLSGIAQIQCVSPSSCIALGTDMAGAANTIVYSYGS